MRGERVLITGGSGFIDSKPAEALVEEKDVYWLSRRSVWGRCATEEVCLILSKSVLNFC